MRTRKRVTKADVIVVLIVIITAIGGIVFMNALTNKGYMVKVSRKGEVVKEAYLDDAGKKEFKIRDDNGKVTNVVVISDGYVFVESASCSNQRCVKKGRISEDGEFIACSPNDVLVEVVKDNSIEESPF